MTMACSCCAFCDSDERQFDAEKVANELQSTGESDPAQPRGAFGTASYRRAFVRGHCSMWAADLAF